MKPITALVLLFLTICLQAQESDPTMEALVKGGSKGIKKFLIKTNPTTMISGDFPLYGEIRVSRKLSVEAGAGLQSRYFVKELVYIVYGKDPFAIKGTDEELEATGGYSFRVFPKYFIWGDNLQGFAIGPFWRTRQYNIAGLDNKVHFSDLCLMFSQQAKLTRQPMYFEYYIGFGQRTLTFPDNISSEMNKRHFTMPWGVKVGYGF